jgi:predicted nucleic acid-binding protein
VVIDLEQLEADQLPIELAVSAITMAELAAGPHATGDADERARRQDRLQRAEAAFDPLPFDGEATLAPMGGSTLPKSRADARRVALEQWIS